jgi:hypothetical protein
MIPEIDIWRAASLMLKRYDEKAIEVSAARRGAFRRAGSSTQSASSPT